MNRHSRLMALCLAGLSLIYFVGYSLDASQKKKANPADQEKAKPPAKTVDKKESDKKEEPNSETVEVPEHEKPFWESAQAFVDAYVKRDAKAIGELFTENAEFYDEFGELTEGRDAIVAMYQQVFETNAESIIEAIQIERVRQVTPTVALEEGIVVASDTVGGPLYRNRYVALHVLGDDGRWLINTLKDHPRDVGNRQEQLARLSWLLGDWVNEDDNTVVHTSCEWSEDGNYLLRRFTLQTFDGFEMDGVQRVGWDPQEKKLRSWTFDSEGGFFTGVWTQNGNEWHLSMAGVNNEGLSVSATTVFNVIDDEMITWQLRNIVVGDVIREAGPLVTLVRRPPAPIDAKDDE